MQLFGAECMLGVRFTRKRIASYRLLELSAQLPPG